MKRLNIYSALAALAAVALSACSVQEKSDTSLGVEAGPTVTVNFTTSSPQTKTAFGEQESDSFPAFWTSNDETISMSLNFGEPVEASVVKDSEVSRKADFTATFADTGKPYVFYALSPISAVNALSSSRESWAVNIPTVQTPKADGLSCDEAAMILYSKSESVDAIPEGPIELSFAHATAYCRLDLRNLGQAFQTNGVENAVVTSVDVTYSIPVAGSWYLDPATGAMEEKEASYTISLNPSIEDLSQPTDIWYAMAPCTLDGQTVKVSVNSAAGSIVREYTFGTRTYASGTVNKLSLDMTRNTQFVEYSVATEETVYQLVTSLSDLSANDEIIFVDAKSPSYAMTATNDGTSGVVSVAKDAATGFTYSSTDGYIRLPEGSVAAVFTVASKSGSSLTFKTGTKYLTRVVSGSSHYLSVGTSSYQFTTAISEGAASLSYKSGSGKTTYSVYHNGTRFAMNTSTSSVIKELAIYKKTTVTNNSNADPSEDPVLESEQYGAYLSSGTAAHQPGVSQTSRDYAASSVVFSILFPEENAVLEFSGIPAAAAKGDAFDLVYTKINGRKKTVVGTYSVSVIKEEGAKLWLSDLYGNGFIVKR